MSKFPFSFSSKFQIFKILNNSKFQNLAARCAPEPEQSDIPMREYEGLYFAHAEDAFSWQEEVGQACITPVGLPIRRPVPKSPWALRAAQAALLGYGHGQKIEKLGKLKLGKLAK